MKHFFSPPHCSGFPDPATVLAAWFTWRVGRKGLGKLFFALQKDALLALERGTAQSLEP